MMRRVRSLVVAASALAILACGPGREPVGQAPMVEITAASLETLRQQFNAASDRPRVVLLLSPT